MSPTPSTYQTNSMPMAPGTSAPGLDSSGFISNIALKRRVVTKTAAYQVLASESGTIFNNYGATAAVTFTLPAVAECAGCEFLFFSAAATALTVASSGSSDDIIALNDLTADSVAYQSTSLIIGGGFYFVSDGVKWYFGALVAGVTQTVTKA